MKRVHPKVKAGGAGGAAAVLVVFLLEQFGVSLPPDVAAAVSTLAGAVAGWLGPAA